MAKSRSAAGRVSPGTTSPEGHPASRARTDGRAAASPPSEASRAFFRTGTTIASAPGSIRPPTTSAPSSHGSWPGNIRDRNVRTEPHAVADTLATSDSARMVRRRSPLRDRAAFLEAADRFPVVAELEQDVLRVLAELGDGTGGRPAVAREVDRRGDAGDARPVGLRDVDEGAGRDRLRVADDLLGGLDGRPPHAHPVEDRAPFGERARREDLVEETHELGTVVPPAGHRREARVLEPLGTLDGPHEIRPVALALEAEEPEPAAVARTVAVDNGVRRRRARERGRRDAEAERRARVPAEDEDADAQE